MLFFILGFCLQNVMKSCDMKETNTSQNISVSMSDKINAKLAGYLIFHDLPGDSSFHW